MLSLLKTFRINSNKFEIFVKEGEIWNSIYTGTVIGYKKIISVRGKKPRK